MEVFFNFKIISIKLTPISWHYQPFLYQEYRSRRKEIRVYPDYTLCK